MSVKDTTIETGEKVNSKPLVSVITPAYNSARFVTETLSSVAEQSFGEFEHIVINDGSDDTPELRKNIEPFKDRIIYIERPNGGAGAARNSGVNIARGEYLAFVDADDVWDPGFLESQIETLRERSLDMIYSDARYFGAVKDPERSFFDRSPSVGEVNAESLIASRCNVILSGTLVKTSLVREVGGFTEVGLPVPMEDFDLWFRLAKQGARIGYQNKILLSYRVHESNISGDEIDMARRDLHGVQFVAQKYDLTKEELREVRDRVQVVEEQISTEEGKRELVNGNFEKAREHFSRVQLGSRGLKTKIIGALVSFNPRFARVVFKMIRKQEFERLAAE